MQDRNIVETFVAHLRDHAYSGLQVDCWPDDENRDFPNIDAIAGPHSAAVRSQSGEASYVPWERYDDGTAHRKRRHGLNESCENVERHPEGLPEWPSTRSGPDLVRGHQFCPRHSIQGLHPLPHAVAAALEVTLNRPLKMPRHYTRLSAVMTAIANSRYYREVLSIVRVIGHISRDKHSRLSTGRCEGDTIDGELRDGAPLSWRRWRGARRSAER
jgi:hypothetical protein